MGLLSFLGQFKSASAGGASSSSKEKPTAVEYVEWLLKSMANASRNELVIDTDHAVPDEKQFPKGRLPPCVPDASFVINRLKVLAGVPPVRQQTMVDASFERQMTNHTMIVNLQFRETEKKSVCMIRLRARV